MNNITYIAACAVLCAAVAFGPCEGALAETGDDTAAKTNDTQTTAKPASKPSKNQGGKWTYKKGGKTKVSYRYDDGTYPEGVVRIGKGRYYFKGSHGKLSKSKKAYRFVKWDGKRYCAGSDGKLLKGWQVSGSKLMYFGAKDWSAVRSKTVDGIRLSSDGVAITNLNAALKTKCIKVLDKITDRTASRKKQLRAAWNYVTSSKFTFDASLAPNLRKKNWAKACAYEMLTTKYGECYGFAATFAALAYEIGYKPKVCTCYIWFTAPSAAGEHGCVTINGRWFDPEGQHRGRNNTGVYNKTHHTRRHIVSPKFKYFHKYKGSGKPVSASGIKLETKTAYQVDKRGKYYYGYKDGRKLKGLHIIKGKLYHFSSKGRQTVKGAKKLWKASAKDAPWKALKKLLGKPLSKKVLKGRSCFGEGVDVKYTYKRFSVSVLKPDEGKQVVESLRAA